jgi:DNA-binding transcriptional ArsR family regulator/uncharacterized protein YndB with AHSA1/START domain
MDRVFKAINDPSRRLLLDALFAEDGQTLGELCGHLPEMTRFGVMNHLKVLEEAGLVTTQKIGRSKYHYLNPVPIRLIHDRWIDKFAEFRVGAITALKTHVERGARQMKPDHVYTAYIATDPASVWEALTNGDYTIQYFYGTRVESDWEPGAALRYLSPEGGVVADGEVIAADHAKRLEIMFHARWDPELEAEGPVREVWLLEATDEGATRLSVELYDAPETSRTYRDFTGGFPFIISGMKTLLETGEPMAH